MNNNKALTHPFSLVTIILTGTIFSSSCFSSDISQNIRNNTEQLSSSENYLEIGGMIRVRDEATFKGANGRGSYTSTGLFINGSYTWNNIFIENYSESGHGLAVGYNAGESWQKS